MSKKLSVVVGFLVVLAGVPGIFMKTDASGLFSGSAHGPSSANIGQANGYGISVTDTGSSFQNAIVDVEVHDAANAKVFQQFFDNQNFAGGQTQNYNVSWAPSAPGTYSMDVGVFGSGWSGPLSWNDKALTVQVAGVSFTASAALNPSSPVVGQSASAQLSVRSAGGSLANGIVDFEVYNSSNAKVFQQFFNNQNFAAGQTQNYNVSWTPSASGAYAVKVGVFSSNWAQTIAWLSPLDVTVRLTAVSPIIAQSATPTPVTLAADRTQAQDQVIQAPVSSTGFYVQPGSSAAVTAAQIQVNDPADAQRLTIIANQPQATWFGGWNANVGHDVQTLTDAATAAGKTAVLVAYNIPFRDCGGYSAGGATTADQYKAWINAFANGIGSRSALVILEPDALASMSCLSSSDQTMRLNLLTYAVQTLKAHSGTHVYIDAGNANWVPAVEMAPRLRSAGIAQADGFSLNVSNFQTTTANMAFGVLLASYLGGKHFVIDTSRDGVGPTPDNQWCNPPQRALGALPTVNTGNGLADAFLWIKRPGESDGSCNGGPSAGNWWPQYAEMLAQVAGY